MTRSSQEAWAVRPPFKLSGATISKCTRRRCLRTTPSACAPTVCESTLSADQKAIAEAAVKVTHLISRNALSLTTLDLLAFCNVKSIPFPLNIWDRTYLESAARRYQKNELLARTKDGPEWEALTEKAKIKLLHEVCNGEGDVTYVDPATGYTVFTFFAHLKRGKCCGIKEKDGIKERTHRCRHCPYKDDGSLGDRMLAINERVPLVEYVRKRVGESWQSFDGLELESEQAFPADGVLQTPRGLSESELRAKYTKVVKIEKKEGDWRCDTCSDEKIVTCARCSGWTYLFSPELMKCPQCSGKGYHPCINCTSFRPPQLSSFYS